MQWTKDLTLKGRYDDTKLEALEIGQNTWQSTWEDISLEPDESKPHNLSVSGQLFSQDPQEQSTKALCICYQGIWPPIETDA